jgi:dGTPase
MAVQPELALAATPDAFPWNRRRHDRSKRDGDPRTSFDVDRDRIIHSATFRELQYKTQVQGLLSQRWPQVFRTRLNHVLEVAQIAEGLSRLLGANEALAKAIALAHDLGHPPFGHAGERALRDELRARGRKGWNANVHSLAVVDDVEASFIEFRGLDLTWATREGIARHSTPFDEPVTFGEFAEMPSGGLECQVVDAADVYAYLSHDLDDAVEGGYVELDDLSRADPILGELVEAGRARWDGGHDVWPEEEGLRLVRRWLIATLIHRLLRDTAETTHRNLQRADIDAPEELRGSADRMVQPSPDYGGAVDRLLRLLTEKYYRSERVAETDQLAGDLVRKLLDALIDHTNRIPSRFRRGDEIIDAATYLASLNDHTAVQLAKDLGIEVDNARSGPDVRLGG